MKIGIFTSSTTKKGSKLILDESKKFVRTAKERGHDCKIFVSSYFNFLFDEKGTTLFYKNKKLPKLDVVISKIGVSKNIAEKTTSLKEVEIMKIPVLNRFFPVLKAKNKFHTFQILSSKKFPVIKTVLLADIENLDFAISKIGKFPILAKAISGSHGKGVAVFETRRSLISGLELMITNEKQVDSILLQEFVKVRGRDYRLFVVGNRVIAQMQRKAPTGEFRSNIALGGSGKKVDLSKEVQDLAVEATQALGLDFAGVDILLTKEGPKICEVNANPGLKISEITGVDVVSEIIKLAEQKVLAAKE